MFAIAGGAKVTTLSVHYCNNCTRAPPETGFHEANVKPEVVIENGNSQACHDASTHLDQDLSTMVGGWGEPPRSEDH